MPAWLKRLRIEMEDWLRYQPLLRGLLSRWLLFRHARFDSDDPQVRARAIRDLCAAARLTGTAATVTRCIHLIHEILPGLDPRAVDWYEFFDKPRHPTLNLSELIKAPRGDREKGVLYLAFEMEWLRLLLQTDIAQIARRYHVVLAPSSSPHNLINYVFPAAFPGRLFTQISNAHDMAVLPQIAANYTVVPLYASSWVHPDRFQPRARAERDIDLIMIANFAKVKRHYALFRALRTMPPSLRVHLIGQDQDGNTGDSLVGLARAFGVAERFTLERNASYRAVAEALCRSRASVILSRREGSCVVIAESLFADAPAALLQGAEIGSAAFINPMTGRFLQHRDLGGELAAFIAESDRYEPRAWAQEHITCFRSTGVLNGMLREHALAAGEEWTEDIAPMTWRPFPRLVHAADHERLRAARADFRQRYGLAIGEAGET